MDRKWVNRMGFEQPKPRKSRSDYQVEENTQPFRDVDEGIWDFERPAVQSNQAGFAYTRRAVSPNYRLVGETTKAAYSSAQPSVSPLATQLETARSWREQSRPNRYNSKVKMVPGDVGPAPWEYRAQTDYHKLPVMGQVAAGRYDVTVAYQEPGYGSDADFVLVNTEEIKVNRGTFALRVRGQSMIGNEIDDGDIIIVQAQDWADDGDFVVACLTDSSDSLGMVTLKRFYRHGDRIVLQPANPSLSPIHILPNKGDSGNDDLDAVKIQGRVVAIVKSTGLL